MEKSVIQRPLSINFKENELIKVSPVGEVKGLDGRKFKIDAKSLVESIQKNSLDIVLDENHSFGGAVGWFSKDSFEIRDDGIYAKLELNKKGKELVENRVYRYLSPVYDVSGGGVVALDSVGLVNRPNLLNNALNFKGEKMDIKDSQEYKALQSELDKVKAQNEALKNDLNSLKKEKDEDDEKDKDDSRKDTGANKDGVKKDTELNSKISNLNKKIDEMSKNLEAMSGFFGKKNLEANAKESLSKDEKKIALMLGLSEDEYKGAK